MLINQYLRARWLSEWSPQLDRPFDRKIGPTKPLATDPFDLSSVLTGGRRVAASTLDVVARNVDDFIGWWEAVVDLEDGKDLDDRLLAAREKVLQEYGDSMASGEWSRDGKPLSNSTIRSRQSDALQFLRWAKRQGRAPELVLSVIEREARIATYSGARKSITRRSYSVLRRADPRRIAFPDRNEVRDHVLSVGDPAAQLGAMLVFGCGLRASEVINLSADPFGGKRSGALRYLKVRGKGSKTRLVEIEAFLVDKILFYKDFDRSIRANARPKESPTDKLLLRRDGSPFDYRSFYRAFRKAGSISPHLGRHWYAVNFLLQAKADRQIGHIVEIDVLRVGLETELIRLQQNLGHADISTTYDYLVALSQVLRPVSLQAVWEGLLDA